MSLLLLALLFLDPPKTLSCLDELQEGLESLHEFLKFFCFHFLNFQTPGHDQKSVSFI